jgi:hypothetical protein
MSNYIGGQQYENFGAGHINTIKKSNRNIGPTLNQIQQTPFLFLQEHKNNYKNVAKTALENLHEETDLNRTFFSAENMKRIQKKIKEEIYRRTNGKIVIKVDQDESDLLVAMQATYFAHARHIPGKTIHEVKKLNELTLDEVIPDMITAIKQEHGYLRDINAPLKPIARPMSVNVAKPILPSITTIWEDR